MSPTEQRYAQIEKEALGITWAIERFADYLLGLRFHFETDHKPLVSSLGTKNLENDALHIHYQPWPAKDLRTADTLSQAPIVGPLNQEEEKLTDDVKAYVNSAIKHLPATEDRLEQLRSQQQQVAKQLIANCSDRWPEKSRLPSAVTASW